ncbi:hypothetical protein BpHYR1_046768 [Brachionus plicatilis]|uniref:Uncharacterized protein n=1 Tax=Brachionus plicatilis TaxID=10195 RepID=A0A3M7Q260_BRAPC|nr:hypothetical protein BpHYR1_046768 [Brachionus plicatilis]
MSESRGRIWFDSQHFFIQLKSDWSSPKFMGNSVASMSLDGTTNAPFWIRIFSIDSRSSRSKPSCISFRCSLLLLLDKELGCLIGVFVWKGLVVGSTGGFTSAASIFKYCDRQSFKSESNILINFSIENKITSFITWICFTFFGSFNLSLFMFIHCLRNYVVIFISFGKRKKIGGVMFKVLKSNSFSLKQLKEMTPPMLQVFICLFRFTFKCFLNLHPRSRIIIPFE